MDCDWRMVYVPARDHLPGARRKVFDGSHTQYPRIVDPERAEAYQPVEGMQGPKLLGSIPQVEHTYALWENTYGLMNEHGLGLGESTAAGRLVGESSAVGGDAMFSIGTLMAIALERCKTARCAIQTMGDLGSAHGSLGKSQECMVLERL